MNFCNEILTNMFDDHTVSSINEGIDAYNIEANCSVVKILKEDELKNKLVNLTLDDRIRIKIYDKDDVVCKYSSEDNIDYFIEELRGADDEIKRITGKVDNKLNIYDLNAFISYFNKLSFSGILQKFSELINKQYIVFTVLDREIECRSDAIIFTSNKSKEVNYDEVIKYKKIDKRNELCNIIGKYVNDFIVEDFDIINSNVDIISNFF